MRKSFLFFIITLILFSCVKFTYADDYSEAIIKAKKNLNAMNDISDRTKLLKVRGDFERILQLKKNEWMVDYWLAYVDLLTAWSYLDMETGKNDNDNVKKYTESSISLLDKAGVYYTPEAFGGGPDKAKPELEKSWDLFQTYKIKDDTYPDWGKEQAAGMIAMCYISNDKLDDAKKWIDKALEVNPNSGFIKNYIQKQYDAKAKK